MYVCDNCGQPFPNFKLGREHESACASLKNDVETEPDDAVCHCGELIKDHHQGSSCTTPKEMPADDNALGMAWWNNSTEIERVEALKAAQVVLGRENVSAADAWHVWRDRPIQNTDVEVFRETPGDYYSPSAHVTADRRLGINVGGTVIVMPLRDWHRAVQVAQAFTCRIPELHPGTMSVLEVIRLHAADETCYLHHWAESILPSIEAAVGAPEPTPSTHDTESRDCWCKPEVLQPCQECRDLITPDPECWACDGRGLVDEYDTDAPSVIVHRYDQA